LEQLRRLLLDEQLLPLQSGSAQSMRVSESLSSPSLHELSGVVQLLRLQLNPEPHTEPVPHLHTPAVQVSALVELQAVQVLPGSPHAAGAVPGLQTFPLQQPPGQLVASHTHELPVLQRWPGRQAAPLPHLQLPPVQVSAVAVHAAQFIPPV
jgi:hypothetical protein